MARVNTERGEIRRRVATALVASEIVTDVAKRLAEAEIPVMPVKGALLQRWLCDSRSVRPLTDVDLLVPPAHLGRAVAQLESAGYRRVGGSSVGAVVMRTPLALALDLHPRLFDAARYRLPTHELFARAVVDTSLYGVRVWLPSRLDAYAHLVGKFGSDHLDARSTERLFEIAELGGQLDAPPRVVADHLVRCGMGRVSRYVLALVHRTTDDRVSLAALERLPPDRIGDAIAAMADQLLPRCAPSSSAGAVIAHLMNDSLPRALVSGARGALRRSRRG